MFRRYKLPLTVSVINGYFRCSWPLVVKICMSLTDIYIELSGVSYWRQVYNVPDHVLGNAKCSALFSHILDNFQKPTTMPDEEQIKRALAYLKAQKKPNITVMARQFKIAPSTLSDRFYGKTVSHEEATANTRLKLSLAQEKILIVYINKLSDRGLPSTPRIVRNLIRELSKTEIGEHWVSRFYKRYKDELSNVYLRVINYKRKIVNNSFYFKHYFKFISL
jgi:hypothetical protein